MKRSALLAILFLSLLATAVNKPEFGRITPFEKDNKWGLMKNGEICLLPTFESIKPLGNYFVFTENGKEGILSSTHILSPAIYDKILYADKYSPAFTYLNGNEKGFGRLYSKKYIDYNNNIVEDTVSTFVIYPGQFKEFMLNTEANSGSPIYAICQTHEGDFKILNINNGADLTPFYDMKKLGGNIKDVLKGKIPLSQLKVKRTAYDTSNDFDKLFKKHPELKGFDRSNLRLIEDKYKFSDEEILEHIVQGPFKGVITDIGVISIPLEYSSTEDVLKRDPSNLYALTSIIIDESRSSYPNRPSTFLMSTDEKFEINKQHAADLYAYYKSFIPVWKKIKSIAIAKNDSVFIEYANAELEDCISKADEAEDELSKYQRISNITTAMNSFASGLLSAASSMQNKTAGYSVSQPVSGNLSQTNIGSSSKTEKYDLNEQVSYNRDKKTYSQYDSQLSAHFAGNRTMSTWSVSDAQKKMRDLRQKWVDRGKSFPKSANEDR